MLHVITTGEYYPAVVTTWKIFTTGTSYLTTGTLCTVECWKFYWSDDGEEGQFLKASTRLATLTNNFRMGTNPGCKQVLPPFLQVRHLHTYERGHLREDCCQLIIHLFKIVAILSAEPVYIASTPTDGFVFEVECWQFYNSVRSSGRSAISQSLDQTCNFDRFQFVRKSNGIDCGLRNSDSDVVEIPRLLKNYIC